MKYHSGCGYHKNHVFKCLALHFNLLNLHNTIVKHCVFETRLTVLIISNQKVKRSLLEDVKQLPQNGCSYSSTHNTACTHTHACIHTITASHLTPHNVRCLSKMNAHTLCQICHIMKPINAICTCVQFVLNMLHKPPWFSVCVCSLSHQ